jgi:hypothetical protein
MQLSNLDFLATPSRYVVLKTFPEKKTWHFLFQEENSKLLSTEKT